MVKGSHEGHQEFDFGSDICIRPSCQSVFHYVKYKHPTLEVKLPKKDLDYAFVCCSTISLLNISHKNVLMSS